MLKRKTPYWRPTTGETEQSLVGERHVAPIHDVRSGATVVVVP